MPHQRPGLLPPGSAEGALAEALMQLPLQAQSCQETSHDPTPGIFRVQSLPTPADLLGNSQQSLSRLRLVWGSGSFQTTPPARLRLLARR